jgi:hypothetical protein
MSRGAKPGINTIVASLRTQSTAPPTQHHDNTPLRSPPPGDTDCRPKVKVLVISRNTELATTEADLSLVLVALVGSNRPAVLLAEVRDHLSSVFHVSEGATTICP